MSKILKTVGYIAISFVLGLALVEVALQLSGSLNATLQREYVVKSYAAPEIITPPEYIQDFTYEMFISEENRKLPTILAIGDSMVNFGSVGWPLSLYQLVNTDMPRYNVYNMGKCDDPIFYVKERLKQAINIFKGTDQLPKLVLVQAGALDYYRSEITPDVTEHLMPRYAFKDVFVKNSLATRSTFLEKIKLFKLYRYLKITMLGKKLQTNPIENKKKIPELLKRYHEMLSDFNSLMKQKVGFKDPRVVKIADELRRLADRHIYIIYHTYDKFGIMKLNELDHFIINFADGIFNLEANILNYAGMLDAYTVLFDAFGDRLWTSFERYDDQDDRLPYILIQGYQLQAKYSAQDFSKILTANKAKYPSLSKSIVFDNTLTVFKKWDAVEAKINISREKAWSEIVEVSKANNFKLAILNYPQDYQATNRFLAQIAKKYNLALVDINSELKKENQGDRSKFLDDQQHMTTEGQNAVGKIIYKSLSRKGLL